MKMYALKDVKAGTFSPVMMAQNDAHMSRTLEESLGGTQATPARYPQDYELFFVGEFDDTTAGVVGEVRFVCNLSVILSENGGKRA